MNLTCQKAVNWALWGIGIPGMASPSARWIASDVLRELRARVTPSGL